MKLRTKRLTLVPLTAEMLELLIEDPVELEKLLGCDIEMERDSHMLCAYREMYDAGCDDNAEKWDWYTEWLIILRSENKAVGGIGFKAPPDQNNEVEVGYGVSPGYSGKGITSEALEAMLNWAFSHGVYYVKAETDPNNAASKAVLAKYGFKPVGWGEEGPVFETEKPKSIYAMTYMACGLALGAGVGASSGKLVITMCLGLALGFLIGTLLDAKDKKMRKR